MLSTECQGAVEPIAILGMGCRFPGDSTSSSDIETPEELWQFLQRKGDAYTDFPKDRLNLDAWHHPEAGHPASFYTRGGCFLKKDSRHFDPSFFNISLQEARSMDPAQRKLLEVAYEAFESSGTPLSRLMGSETGCFIGNFNADHQVMQLRDADYPQPYAITGGGAAILSNRISHIFDLQGPSLTLDTACSSSFYALHLACSAIQSGDCTAAVVGASNLILTPDCQTLSSALGSVSPTSRCHTFDAAADGYARAEGVAVIYIKSLRRAIADKDPIRAIIRGTAINANGRTGGITHPDPDGQERVIRRAYERAGNLNPDSTSYVECHGTGTPVGDPLEIEALGRVFAENRSAGQPLLLGSIKSNMGHCEAASGIAGLIKTVMALQNKTVPPIRILKTLNPNLNLREGCLKIVTESIPWPEAAVRRASINSFGYGGANGHVILDEAPNMESGLTDILTRPLHTDPDTADTLSSDSISDSSDSDTASCTTPATPNPIFYEGRKLPQHNGGYQSLRNRSHFLLPFSAHNEQTLTRNMQAVLTQLGKWRSPDLEYTLACRRSAFSVRSFVIASRGQIENAQLSWNTVTANKVPSSPLTRVGFVFTGQGAQAPGMAKELMENFSVYLESIRYMDSILSKLTERPDWSIEQELCAFSEESRVYRANMSQPLVTAVQVALVDLLRSWNIMSIANVGHSSGEIACAYASGHISAAAAIVIAYARGRAIARNNIPGAMLAVGSTLQELQDLLATKPGVEVACYNSPESYTLSGEPESIAEVKASLDSRKMLARILPTDGNAYHSSHMEALGPEYEEEMNNMLASIEPHYRSRLLPKSRYVPSVGKSNCNHQPTDTRYWRQNLERPVMFADALRNMMQSSPVDILIEIGPHSALQGPVRQTLQTISTVTVPDYIPTIVRGRDSAECLLQTAGLLWTKGYEVNFTNLSTAQNCEGDLGLISACTSPTIIVDLPKYQWQYGDIMYSENRLAREIRLKTHGHHDILGSRQAGGNQNQPTWRNVLNSKRLSWLNDHTIGLETVLPAAGYVMMAIEAVLQVTELKGTTRTKIFECICENIEITSALNIPEEGNGVEILFSLSRSRLNRNAYNNIRYNFTVTSVTSLDGEDVFTEHAYGNVTAVLHTSQSTVSCRIYDTKSLAKPISTTRWYDTFASIGLEYGATFQCLSGVTVSEQDPIAISHINLDTTKKALKYESIYPIHPASLDSVIQLGIIAAHRGRSTECTTAFLPVSLDKISVNTSFLWDTKAKASARSTLPDSTGFTTDITVYSMDGNILIEIEGLHLTAVELTPPTEHSELSTPFTKLLWQPDVDLLQGNGISRYYSTTEFERMPARPLLDELALSLVLQFNASYPMIFSQGSENPVLQRYLTWMEDKVNQASENPISGGFNNFNQSVSERDSMIADLLSKLMHSHGAETRLMYHLYQSLPNIFAGEISGIAVAVQNNYLNEFYQNTVLNRRGTKALSEVVAMISHKNPNQAIFEVGGGTGSATRSILHRLQGSELYRGYSTYTFTDVSTSFLGDAREEFKDFKGVEYTLFDMELPACEQGIHGTYDVVIASNVVHATSNMQATLSNIRSLLKSGGKLVLFEIVCPTLFVTMIIGTFLGAWKGDQDSSCPRTEGPFLTMSMWKDILPRCGFSGVDLTFDYFDEHHDTAVLVATAIDDPPVLAPMVATTSVTIIYRGQPSAFVLQCQEYLQKQNYSVELLHLHDVKSLDGKRVIALVEVDQPLYTELSNAEWDGAKNILLSSESVLWVTRGSLLEGQCPETAMVGGIIATIHAENKSSRVLTLDLDQADTPNEALFEVILELKKKAMNYRPGEDFEYRSKNGVIHVSRLVEDDIPNVVESRLQTIGNIKPSPAQVALHGPNSTGTRHDHRPPPEISPSGAANATVLDREDQVTVTEQTRECNDDKRACFDSAASYILVGCTGGLGRSLARWMVSRGARHLVFLSRTGMSDPKTVDFVKSLEAWNCAVEVVKGDVTSTEHVATVIAAARHPIRGVVLAPLTLTDSLFHDMSLDEFNTTVVPRVTGTLNLHHATKDMKLDFFLTLTSWTKILGSSSQANYTASCAFMDAFALRRQSLGLPASSLSLGHILDVGVVAGNLRYQEHNMQMGLYGNDEGEFLSYCEAAILSSSAVARSGVNSQSHAHILAGMRPSGLKANSKRYPLQLMHWHSDPRFSHLIKATSDLASNSQSSASHDKVTVEGDDAAEPMLVRVHRRVARCLYMPVDDISVDMPIVRYGMDSLIAGELRNWLFGTLQATVSMLNLLQPTMTVRKLVAEVENILVNKLEVVS